MILKRIIIEAEYFQIKQCREEIRKLAEENNFVEEFESAIELSLGEALTNVIEHAQKDLEKKEPIEIIVSKDSEKVETEIIFSGKTISGQQLEKSKTLNDIDIIDELSEGGRGIFIIHALMDKVEYSKDGKLGKIKFTKNIEK